MDERGAGAAGPFKGVPGILDERARLIRGGDHGGTGAAIAWGRGRGGESDAGSWARTVSGSRVARARQAGHGGTGPAREGGNGGALLGCARGRAGRSRAECVGAGQRGTGVRAELRCGRWAEGESGLGCSRAGPGREGKSGL